MEQSYALFASLDANDDGDVGLDELRDMLLRTSVAPIDDEAEERLEAWMAEADADGSNTIDFFEYVRMDARLSATATRAADVEGSSAPQTSAAGV